MLLRCCMILVTVRVKRVTLYAKSISARIREYANAHKVGRLQFTYSWQLAAFFSKPATRHQSLSGSRQTDRSSYTDFLGVYHISVRCRTCSLLA